MSDNARDTRHHAGASQRHHGPLTRRWTEQRWLLDSTIRSVGMDWDQPRSVYLAAPCGPGAAGDFMALRQRIQKYADVHGLRMPATRRHSKPMHVGAKPLQSRPKRRART